MLVTIEQICQDLFHSLLWGGMSLLPRWKWCAAWITPMCWSSSVSCTRTRSWISSLSTLRGAPWRTSSAMRWVWKPGRPLLNEADSVLLVVPALWCLLLVSFGAVWKSFFLAVGGLRQEAHSSWGRIIFLWLLQESLLWRNCCHQLAGKAVPDHWGLVFQDPFPWQQKVSFAKGIASGMVSWTVPSLQSKPPGSGLAASAGWCMRGCASSLTTSGWLLRSVNAKRRTHLGTPNTKFSPSVSRLTCTPCASFTETWIHTIA